MTPLLVLDAPSNSGGVATSAIRAGSSRRRRSWVTDPTRGGDLQRADFLNRRTRRQSPDRARYLRTPRVLLWGFSARNFVRTWDLWSVPDVQCLEARKQRRKSWRRGCLRMSAFCACRVAAQPGRAPSWLRAPRRARRHAAPPSVVGISFSHSNQGSKQ